MQEHSLRCLDYPITQEVNGGHISNEVIRLRLMFKIPVFEQEVVE